jgi:hypothetical protein
LPVLDENGVNGVTEPIDPLVPNRRGEGRQERGFTSRPFVVLYGPPLRRPRGQQLECVPLEIAPKLALYLAIREAGISNSEVGRRLGVSETVVRRMLNPRYVTMPEKIQAALAALEKRIVVRFEDAA